MPAQGAFLISLRGLQAALAALPISIIPASFAPALAGMAGMLSFESGLSFPLPAAQAPLRMAAVEHFPAWGDAPAAQQSATRPAAGSNVAQPFASTSLALEAGWPAATPEFDPGADEDPFAAGFSLAELMPPLGSFCGSMAPIYPASKFSINPVWLPELFAIANLMTATPRACGWSDSDPVRAEPGISLDIWPADGPSFSGMLAWPAPSAVYWEFRETWSPPDVVEPGLESIRASMPSDRNPWNAALRFWRSAPALARGMALAVPLIVPALIFGPTIEVNAHTAQLDSFKEAIRARASVDIQDDFHDGLKAWTGKEGWSFGPAGSARPGRLSLLRDTIPLADYQLEFLGQIDTKALGFVFRAQDASNYYAAKLVVVKAGPLPSLALVRYNVIDGREGPKIQAPLNLQARSDTIYRVLVTAQGDHFSVDVNGQFAASWSDERLKSGGIGFFSDRGEVALLRSVHVVDKQDFLGRLCSQVSLWTADRRALGVKHE